MRAWLIVIVIELCCAGILQAQTTDCMVMGYLFSPDGSPAAMAQLNVISVVKNGASSVLTPIVLTTDANGFASFAAPRLSTVWISAKALGLSTAGDVAILIPDADSAALDVLAQSAKPPVSGFSLTSGTSPTLALSLQDFGINLNAGPTSDPQTFSSLLFNTTNNLGGADFLAATTANGRFQWTVGNERNVFDPTRDNQVMTIGWNTTGSGGRLDPNEPALSYRIENYYTPAPNNRWMEAHLQYNSTSGKIFRPWGYQVDRTTDASAFHINADFFAYSGRDGIVPYAQFKPDGMFLQNGAALFGNDNNVQLLKQINAAKNAFVTLAYLDDGNRTNIGQNGTGVIANSPYLQVGNKFGPKLANFADVGLSILKADGTGAILVGAATTTPAPASADGFKLYAKKNGNGKTQLCVIFSSGPEQCFATQP